LLGSREVNAQSGSKPQQNSEQLPLYQALSIGWITKGSKTGGVPSRRFDQRGENGTPQRRELEAVDEQGG